MRRNHLVRWAFGCCWALEAEIARFLLQLNEAPSSSRRCCQLQNMRKCSGSWTGHSPQNIRIMIVQCHATPQWRTQKITDQACVSKSVPRKQSKAAQASMTPRFQPNKDRETLRGSWPSSFGILTSETRDGSYGGAQRSWWTRIHFQAS